MHTHGSITLYKEERSKHFCPERIFHNTLREYPYFNTYLSNSLCISKHWEATKSAQELFQPVKVSHFDHLLFLSSTICKQCFFESLLKVFSLKHWQAWLLLFLYYHGLLISAKFLYNVLHEESWTKLGYGAIKCILLCRYST